MKEAKDPINFYKGQIEKLTKEKEKLKEENQLYKDKEDKLRELCEDVRQHDWEAYDVSLEILQILNEGDK